MKNKFLGYIPYEEELVKELWDRAIFVVDANILLNLYRYSETTKEKVVDDLKKVKDRLWIPYNTAQEFFNNRLLVIQTQNNIYNDIIQQINFNPIIDEVNKIRHITLSSKKEEMIKIINTCKESLIQIIEEDRSNNNTSRKDDILTIIVDLFDGKVGEKILDKKLEDYKKVIDERYINSIPPGFKDAKKKKEGRKYGDCINWFSIIEYAKDNGKDIIYVTDDNKDDWFSKEYKTPRMELLQEFYEKTNNKKIYIYNTEGFVVNFDKYINNNEVNEVITNEIKKVAEEDEDYSYYGSECLNDLDSLYEFRDRKFEIDKTLTIKIIYEEELNEKFKFSYIGMLLGYVDGYYETYNKKVSTKAEYNSKIVIKFVDDESIGREEEICSLRSVLNSFKGTDNNRDKFVKEFFIL